MKILIDKNIPYVEHFFADHLDQIEYFTDQKFEINMVREDSVVITRSTYKTHGKKISDCVKFVCSASTGEDHIDKKILDEMKIPYAFSTGANAIAVREYVFSTLALMLQEQKFNKNLNCIGIFGCGVIGDGICKVLDHFDFKFCVDDPFVEHGWYCLDEYLYDTDPSSDSDPYGKSSWQQPNVGDDPDQFPNAFNFISLHVPLHYHNEFSTKPLINKVFLQNLTDGAIIVNTSRGGVVSEKDFLELDDDRHYIRLISDVFENEPNINEDFLNKNLFATPHIAGHSQFARYQMTKMAYENVMDFLGQEINERNSILENKIINFDKNTFDQDMKEFGLPVSLMLDTYNPKLDHFECADFKKTRDNYNSRIGYSQVVIKGCEDDSDRIALKMLGFKVQDS